MWDRDKMLVSLEKSAFLTIRKPVGKGLARDKKYARIFAFSIFTLKQGKKSV